ncbi:MAG: hypothetical protein FJX35_10560 [Alphaproteobacteria bacterium]|nr:hypothetical protein [Alphaproteobacteria bacterium]
MAVTAISNGIGLNALGPSARLGTSSSSQSIGAGSTAPEQGLPGTQRRELSPTGAPAAPPVVGQRKAPVDLPGLVTAQEAKVPGQERGDGAKQKGELSDEEKQIVAKLRARDQEVRRHEQAHAAAGGQYAGAPSYTYQAGPDGKQYAIGGSTPIDASPIPGDPEATVRKMEQVRRAALAPGSPSGADQAIAAAATAAALQARQAAAAQRRQQAEAAQAEAQQAAGVPQVGTGQAQPAAPGATQAEGGGAQQGGGASAASGISSNFTPPPLPPVAVQVGVYARTNTLAMHGMPMTLACSCLACMPREIRSSTSF